MSDKHLHIISFDVPYPPNYGGVKDVFSRIKRLSESGVRIHLHCFAYGREPQPQLENYCEEVCYYRRDTSLWMHGGLQPYIVRSRKNSRLLERLLKDDYPVWCEGLHTTALLTDRRFADRKVYVRLHNVEHDYYRQLSKAEKSCWKRLFFRVEALKLRRYERLLRRATALFAITPSDAAYYAASFASVHYLPPFGDSDQVSSLTGTGNYLLYHANLSVPENEKAAEYLLEQLFSKIDFPCCIAGLHPTAALLRKVEQYPHIRLVANPSEEEMDELVRNAQANVLVTFQSTGLKMKLLNALYKGRFCVVNRAMVSSSGLAQACRVADTPEALLAETSALLRQPFTEAMREERQRLLQSRYCDARHVDQLLHLIFHP